MMTTRPGFRWSEIDGGGDTWEDGLGSITSPVSGAESVVETTLVRRAASGADLPNLNHRPNARIHAPREYEGNWGPYSPVGVLCWHHLASRRFSLRWPRNPTQRQQLLFIRHPKRGWYFEFSTSACRSGGG